MCERAYLLLVCDECVTVLRDEQGYTLPGGEVVQDETHENCLTRHCLNRIGYDIRVDELVFEQNAQFFYCGSLLDPLMESDTTPVQLPIAQINEYLSDPIQRSAIRAHCSHETSAAALAFIDGKHEFYG